MEIRECSAQDVPDLAQMNQWLIEDENDDTYLSCLSLEQLEERMRGFISSKYKAFLFLQNEMTVGYALCNMSKSPVYLRQFFIRRDKRRNGYGKQALSALLNYLDIQEIDIDVFSWNKVGIAFWKACGFKLRCHNMRYSK